MAVPRLFHTCGLVNAREKIRVFWRTHAAAVEETPRAGSGAFGAGRAASADVDGGDGGLIGLWRGSGGQLEFRSPIGPLLPSELWAGEICGDRTYITNTRATGPRELGKALRPTVYRVCTAPILLSAWKRGVLAT